MTLIYSVWVTCQWSEVVYLEPGRIVTVVEGMSEACLLGFSECLGKAKVTESGAGRVNSGKWEVFVRAMFVFCRRACRDSRRVVMEEETIVFGLHGDSELKRNHS